MKTLPRAPANKVSEKYLYKKESALITPRSTIVKGHNWVT